MSTSLFIVSQCILGAVFIVCVICLAKFESFEPQNLKKLIGFIMFAMISVMAIMNVNEIFYSGGETVVTGNKHSYIDNILQDDEIIIELNNGETVVVETAKIISINSKSN